MKAILKVTALVLIAAPVFAQSEAEGMKAMENENYATAKTIFEGVAKANPADANKLFNWAEALYAEEKFDSAKIIYLQGTTVNPKLPQNFIGLGKCLQNAGNKTEAKKNFDKALDLASSKDPIVPSQIAIAYVSADKNNNADAAIDMASKAVTINKKSSKAYEALGDAFLAKNDGGHAMSNYEFAVDNDKANKTALLKMGELYIRAKNYTEAVNLFNKALALDAAFAPAHRELADLYFQGKQYDKAKSEYAEYLKYADQTLDAKIRNVKFLYKSKSYENTISSINDLLPQDANNHLLYRLLGYSYMEMDKTAEGTQAMEQFFTKAPADKVIPSDYTTYAKLLQKSGKDSLAVIQMKKAMQADPENTDFVKDVLTLQFKMKKYADVTKDFEGFQSKNLKMDVNAYFLASRSYYVQKEFVKADSANVQITRLAPASASGWIGRAKSNAQLDPESKTWQAKPFYEKYLEVVKLDDPKNKRDIIEAYKYLGFYSFESLKDNAATKAYYEKVIALDPDDKQAKDVLAGLK